MTLVLFAPTVLVLANPTGGVVASGSATIQGGSGNTTVSQTSQAAIINWQSFSINHGESTQFLQPNSQSAMLNRVLGGNASQINGSLLSNGQLYLINQNGILVGPGGTINAAGGFTASTRDITNSDFLSGNLHFVGHGESGVRNLGQITSLLGNVILIGKTVSNSGTIRANSRTAGLVAGDDVLLGQKNADGSTITVNPSRLAKKASEKTGVTNRGSISATSAELKAANGNIYSMAINNGGVIRSTTVNRQGGHIWLTSDSGKISNAGVLDASAEKADGQGGTVLLKSADGAVSHTGSILAKGGVGGTGGDAEVSGEQLSLSGKVDLLAPEGKAGDFVIDPATLDVVSGGTGSIISGSNDSFSTTIDPSTVDGYLQSSGNLTLSASNSVTVDGALGWSSANTLTLQTTYFGTSVVINQPISAPSGGLTLSLSGTTDPITTGPGGSVSVGTFNLTSGYWNQVGSLPGFSASNFVLGGSSNFIRAAGGIGMPGTPYQIVDIYGLQGIGSPSGNNLGLAYVVSNNIDASVTSGWNSGSGFAPIGTSSSFPFQGTLAGQGFTVSNLTVNNSAAAGLFAFVGSSGTINSLSVSGNIAGVSLVGALAAVNQGNISGCSSSATITGVNTMGGLVGNNSGIITGSFSTGAVIDGSMTPINIGGLVGLNSGTVAFSYSTAPVTGSGATDVGGFAGFNSAGGVIQSCSSTGTVSAAGCTAVGGFVGGNNGTISNSYSTSSVTGGTSVGGFAGSQNSATDSTCYSSGLVNGSSQVGGFIGSDSMGTINDCYFATDGSGQGAGIGSSASTSINYGGTFTGNITGLTLAQMQFQSNFDGAWNFALGSGGVWGIDGFSSTGKINQGTPFLQSQYTVLASVVPNDQTTTYNKTNTGTGFSQTAYTATLAPGVSSLASVVSSGPVLTVSGANVNVGTTDAIIISSVTPSNPNAAIEAPPVASTESFSPKPITVSATGGVSSIYGNVPNFSNDGGGAQILSGDTLGGIASYGTTDQFSAGGYLNAGTYTYTPSISGYNSNYTITGYNPATFTINPATLYYFATPATGGYPFPPFSGTVTGFLPGDNLSNSTTGAAIFSTTAQPTSPIGFYAINGSGLNSGNYVFVQAPSNATAFTLVPTQSDINNSQILQQLIDSFENSSGSANSSFFNQTGTISDLDAPLFLGRERDRNGRFGKGSDDYSAEISDIVSDANGRPIIGFTIRDGLSPFERLSRIPPLILDRLERQLRKDVRDQLFDSNRFQSLAQSDRQLSQILDQDGRPTQGFFIRGGRTGFGQQEVPPAVDAQLLNSLSADVREELSEATSEITGSGGTAVTDQNGQPASGFYTRGGFSSFSHGAVPPALAARLELGLNRAVRDELYEAYLSANGTGSSSPSASGQPITDQNGNRVPGFMALPGGFHGFNGATLPPAIMTKMLRGLNADVRDQLSNAAK